MNHHPCPPPDDRAIRPGDHVGCGELSLLGRVERLKEATGPFPARAYVMPLRTVWRGFGDGVGRYLAWWPLRDLHVVDLADFDYCPTRDRYYARGTAGAVPAGLVIPMLSPELYRDPGPEWVLQPIAALRDIAEARRGER